MTLVRANLSGADPVPLQPAQLPLRAGQARRRRPARVQPGGGQLRGGQPHRHATARLTSAPGEPEAGLRHRRRPFGLRPHPREPAGLGPEPGRPALLQAGRGRLPRRGPAVRRPLPDTPTSTNAAVGGLQALGFPRQPLQAAAGAPALEAHPGPFGLVPGVAAPSRGAGGQGAAATHSRHGQDGQEPGGARCAPAADHGHRSRPALDQRSRPRDES